MPRAAVCSASCAPLPPTTLAYGNSTLSPMPGVKLIWLAGVPRSVLTPTKLTKAAALRVRLLLDRRTVPAPVVADWIVAVELAARVTGPRVSVELAELPT